MTKPSVYVFMGNSGAGKDTAASVLDSAKVVKFAAPGKRTIEFIYGLSFGYLDDRDLRLNIAPHSGNRTYLQVLIDFWKHRDIVLGPDLYGKQTQVEIVDCLLQGRDVVINDMRNYNELEIIIDVYKLGYEIRAAWVVGGEKLESDEYQAEIYEQLCSSTCNTGYYLYNNNGKTINEFKEKVKKYLTLFR